MNKKTLLFLDALAENYCTEELTDIAREQLKELFRGTFRQSWPADQTIWVTSDARALKEQLEECWNQILRITRPSEGLPLLKQIPALQGKWKTLHATTQSQLYQPGTVNLDRIHVIRRAEERQFTKWFLELTQIQLYRILTLGGAERFRKLPLLNDQSAEGLLSYYRGQILPALDTLTRAEISGSWAVVWNPDMKLGSRFTIPGCQLEPPKSAGCSILPGQYNRAIRGNLRVYEGRGAMTNITPASILQAQHRGFCSGSQLHIWDMMWMQESDLIMDPTYILEKSTHNALYAVEPYDFFSKWGYVCGLVRLQSRTAEHSCPLCGGILNKQDTVCGACRNAMVQI